MTAILVAAISGAAYFGGEQIAAVGVKAGQKIVMVVRRRPGHLHKKVSLHESPNGSPKVEKKPETVTGHPTGAENNEPK